MYRLSVVVFCSLFCSIFFFLLMSKHLLGFPGGSGCKESACNLGDLGSIPGLGKSLEEDMATHSSILAWRIPKDRGAWWATVHEVTEESDMTEGSASILCLLRKLALYGFKYLFAFFSLNKNISSSSLRGLL